MDLPAALRVEAQEAQGSSSREETCSNNSSNIKYYTKHVQASFFAAREQHTRPYFAQNSELSSIFLLR